MFDTINGLPVHPLVVHAIVVLLPLSVVGTVAIAVRPRWRLTYGALLVVIELVAVVLLPVATSSGEELEKHVGDPGRHAELGDQLIWFAIPLLVLTAALVWLERRDVRSGPATERAPASRGGWRAHPWTTAVAVLAVAAAVANGVQVYRVGDSGARAAWGDQVSSAPAP